MPEKTFEIPDWMEPFLDVLGGRSEVERLMSGPRADTVRNAPLALVQMGMEERIAILFRLHERGMLAPPAEPKDWKLEPEWVCHVVRRGADEGLRCTPEEPHDPTVWRCGYRYELSWPATETHAGLLRLHGFNVTEPPKPKKENPA